MLKKLLLTLLVFIVLLLGIGFLLPTEWEVERSVVIDAAPGAVYSTVATLKTWPDWTYWNRERDPSCEWSFEGPETGPGAVMKWEGNVHMQGSLTIDAGGPATGIQYTLAMQDMTPLQGSIALAPEASRTKATWRTHGASDGMPWSNWLMLLLIEPVMGGFFEEGLNNLKTRVEARAPPQRQKRPETRKAVEASADKGKADKDEADKGKKDK